LRASTGVARISQTTASASGAKGTPTCGITVAGFQARGQVEPDAHSSQAAIPCATPTPLWQRGRQHKYKKCHGHAALWELAKPKRPLGESAELLRFAAAQI
jgi:hypothetical protein